MPVFDILNGRDDGPEFVTISEMLIIPSQYVDGLKFDERGNVSDVFIVGGNTFDYLVTYGLVELRQYKVKGGGKTSICQQIDVSMAFEGRIFKLLSRPVHIIAREQKYGYYFYLGASPNKFHTHGLEYMGIDDKNVSSFGALYDYYAPNVKPEIIDALAIDALVA